MRKVIIASLAFAVLGFSCTDEDSPVIPEEGIEKASLIFTEISGGEGLGAHGDHFHGIDDAVEGESQVIEFDALGNASSGGHLHLDPDGIYKVALEAWDYAGNRVEGDFVQNKETADQYKAFLVGGNILLNADTEDESGAIFQAREKEYGEGTLVDGKYETTGVLTYFTLGHSNSAQTHAVTFIMRKFTDPATKSTVERSDWNRSDYAEAFAGSDILKLNFEIHASEEDHEH
ncbi:hypothetical protein [Echinicola pacifica]|nr:hypothetical protein [Echinicola pacifica]